MGKIGQPAILGEIFAGILLGPTVLGHFRPQWYSGKFPTSGALPIVFKTVTTLGVVFFLLVVGLENSLRFRRGKSELFGSSFGVIFPFVGFIVPACARSFPHFLALQPGATRAAASWKHCPRRVHARACQALEIVLLDRLHLGCRGPDAAELQVETWQRCELTDVRAKAVIYEAFVEGKLEARSETSHPDCARLLLRDEVRRISAADDLEPVECVHFGLQGTEPDSTV